MSLSGVGGTVGGLLTSCALVPGLTTLNAALDTTVSFALGERYGADFIDAACKYGGENAQLCGGYFLPTSGRCHVCLPAHHNSRDCH